MTLYELGLILLTRPDGATVAIRISAIDSIESSLNFGAEENTKTRITMAGNPRFFIEHPDEILNKIEGK